MDISIRPATRNDLPTLQNIRERAFAPIFKSLASTIGADMSELYLPVFEAQQAAHLAELAEAGAPLFVAVEDGRITGFVSYSIDTTTHIGEIGLNAVDPEFAGKGIGKKLYEYVLGRMREAGMRMVEVSAGADDSHAPARSAYEKLGFGHGFPAVTYFKTL